MGISLPLMLSPLMTHQVFQTLYDREAEQIAADNAAISVGRQTRTIFNLVSNFNRWLKSIEVAHHTAHVCARIPAPSALQCQAADKTLEAMIRTALPQMDNVLRFLWMRISPTLRLQSLKLGKYICRLTVPVSAPFARMRCNICGLKTHWSMKPETALRFKIVMCSKFPQPSQSEIELLGTRTLNKSDWNYELKP